jgi:catechol 2,3-dioxygenase-like lactoylglutathione lyase family enzyme
MKERFVLYRVGRAGSPSPPPRAEHRRAPATAGKLRSRPTSSVVLALLLFVGAIARGQEQSPPKIDHMLLEVADLKKSIAFYHDLLGLQIKSESKEFATLEAANVGVFLWTKRWDWEKARAKDERQGLGMYPHFKVNNVSDVVERARKAGYTIVQEPKHYLWGTEAFVADPDGYIWALIS